MSVRNTQVFCVPVVFHDVGGQDSLGSVVEALQHLDMVASQVFDRISTRVSENKWRLANIKNRVATAQARVEHMANAMADRATRVAATAKYPGKERLPDYVSVFDGLGFAEEPVGLAAQDQEEEQMAILPAEVEQAIDTPHKAHEMLNLFWNLSIESTAESTEREMATQPGLGRFPAYMPSVSNLLLFNSEQNPYKQYSTLVDPEQGNGREDKGSNEPGLAAAPTTLTEGDHRPAAQQVDFGFKPKMKALQEFDLPDDLASALPNIVKDQAWEGADQVESIAPSMFLPDLDVKMLADAPGNLPLTDAGGVPPPPVPAAGSAAPARPPTPPPPPPPGAMPAAAPPPPATAAAPAPAPAPAAGAGAGAGAGAAAPPPVKGVPAAIKPARMNLLESIRNAGMKSLKKASDKKRKKKKGKEPPKRPLTMNEELKARLARKRVALGGRVGESKKEPPKRRNTLAKAVTVVTASQRMKKGGDASAKRKAAAPAPPPPPIVEDIAEEDVDKDDASDVSSVASSGADSLADPNTSSQAASLAPPPPPPPVAAPAPAPAPVSSTNSQRRMTALGSTLGQLRRQRADTVDSDDDDDSD